MKEQRGEGGDAKWLLTLPRRDYPDGEEGGRCGGGIRVSAPLPLWSAALKVPSNINTSP